MSVTASRNSFHAPMKVRMPAVARPGAASGTTTGSPGEGQGSSLSCDSYQSGSTQTSATHSTAMAGATGAGDPSPAASRSSAEPVGASGGRGMVPVVKS